MITQTTTVPAGGPHRQVPSDKRGIAVKRCKAAASGRAGAPPHLHQRVAAILVGDAEVVERAERGLQVLGRIEIEAVEAAAREEKQLVALDRATGTQFARVIVALAQHSSLAVAAALTDLGEFDDDQAQPRQGRGQYLDL